jgi:apolipoprotein N-acyltransferase
MVVGSFNIQFDVHKVSLYVRGILIFSAIATTASTVIFICFFAKSKWIIHPPAIFILIIIILARNLRNIKRTCKCHSPKIYQLPSISANIPQNYKFDKDYLTALIAIGMPNSRLLFSPVAPSNVATNMDPPASSILSSAAAIPLYKIPKLAGPTKETIIPCIA